MLAVMSVQILGVAKLALRFDRERAESAVKSAALVELRPAHVRSHVNEHF
jgi:hypothetical protein